MNNNLFTFFATSGGLVVGWTLNELSGLFKSNRENKKILNQILNKQFEIREIILKTDIKGIEEGFYAILLKEIRADDSVEVRALIKTVFGGFIKKELYDRYSSNIKPLIADYGSFIALLSQIDPFTTYTINKKEAALDYLGFIDKYLSGIEPQLKNPVLSDSIPETPDLEPENFLKLFERLRESMTPFIMETAIETIEADIILIAKKIGYWTYFKTIKFLRRTKNTALDNYDMKKIHSYLKNITQSVS